MGFLSSTLDTLFDKKKTLRSQGGQTSGTARQGAEEQSLANAVALVGQTSRTFRKRIETIRVSISDVLSGIIDEGIYPESGSPPFGIFCFGQNCQDNVTPVVPLASDFSCLNDPILNPDGDVPGCTKTSLNHSFCFITGQTIAAGDEPTNYATLDSNDWLRKANVAEYFFKHYMDPDLPTESMVAMYIGFDNGGIRSLPGQYRPSSYDPRTRTWFTHGTNYVNESGITDPYVDGFGRGTMVSFVQSLWAPSYSAVDPYAVVSIDWTLQALNDAIHQIDLYNKTGYAILFQKDAISGSIDYAVLAHGGRNEPSHTADEIKTLFQLEPELDQTEFETLLAAEPVFGTIDVIRVNDNSRSSLVYHSLGEDTLFSNYYVLVDIPYEQVTESIPALQKMIRNTSGLVLGMTILIGLVTVGLTYCCVRLVGDQISKPLVQMTKAADVIMRKKDEKPTAAEEKVDLGDKKGILKELDTVEDYNNKDEMADLIHSFREMIKGLHKSSETKKGNPKYPDNPFYGAKNPWADSNPFN